MTKLFVSTHIMNFRRMGIFIIILVALIAGAPGIFRGHAQVQNQSLPSGYPGAKYVGETGKSLIPFIKESLTFRRLAAGTNYRVTDSSFGYTWGAGTTPTERVVLYSQDGSSYIVTEIEPGSHNVDSMYKGYSPQTAVLTTINAEPNYGGFNSNYCAGTGWFFGTFCDSWDTIHEATANIQIPNSISMSDLRDACCQFAEWTGVSDSGNQNGQNANVLIQGGVTWNGYNTGNLTSMPCGVSL